MPQAYRHTFWWILRISISIIIRDTDTDTSLLMIRIIISGERGGHQTWALRNCFRWIRSKWGPLVRVRWKEENETWFSWVRSLSLSLPFHLFFPEHHNQKLQHHLHDSPPLFWSSPFSFQVSANNKWDEMEFCDRRENKNSSFHHLGLLPSFRSFWLSSVWMSLGQQQEESRTKFSCHIQ